MLIDILKYWLPADSKTVNPNASNQQSLPNSDIPPSSAHTVSAQPATAINEPRSTITACGGIPMQNQLHSEIRNDSGFIEKIKKPESAIRTHTEPPENVTSKDSSNTTHKSSINDALPYFDSLAKKTITVVGSSAVYATKTKIPALNCTTSLQAILSADQESAAKAPRTLKAFNIDFSQLNKYTELPHFQEVCLSISLLEEHLKTLVKDFKYIPKSLEDLKPFQTVIPLSPRQEFQKKSITKTLETLEITLDDLKEVNELLKNYAFSSRHTLGFRVVSYGMLVTGAALSYFFALSALPLAVVGGVLCLALEGYIYTIKRRAKKWAVLENTLIQLKKALTDSNIHNPVKPNNTPSTIPINTTQLGPNTGDISPQRFDSKV